MKSFRVTGKITCYTCIPQQDLVINDPRITALDEASAKDEFVRKHRLCLSCLKSGTEAVVEFDPLITVECLSS